jgi:ubiquinone/menaquinone biosynthesis C-methylase UbiE
MPRVDYDAVATFYDEPARDHVVDPHLLAFLNTRGHAGTSSVRILDIGCGTGKQLAANHGRFPAMSLVGVDRFRGMLDIARRRCRSVAWIQGDGATLPLATASFDYATNQYSYPHIERTRQFIDEVYRTLKPRGRFVMTHIDPWAMPDWLVYQCFPESFELDQRAFVPVERFVTLLRNAGFQDTHVTREDLSKEESVAVFFRYVSDRHRMSQLMAISDEAYAAGLRRIDKQLSESTGRAAMARSEFVRVTIRGDKRTR